MNDMESYFLGLDIGTSAVKAALFDIKGRQQAVALREYALEKPAPDRVELDPEIYWEAVEATVREVIRESSVSLASIKSAGVTSQAETLILLDEAAHPLRKAIVWLDNRAGPEAAEIAEAFSMDEVYRRTGQQEVVPCWPACKILWLKKNEPDIFKKTATFLMVEDYILYRLTGRFVTDHALNPSTLYYDLVDGDWWDEMLEFIGIRRDQLPALQYSAQNGLPVTAKGLLDPQTLVFTTPIDQVTGAVGAGNVAPGMVTETTGSALAIVACCDGPVYDPQRRVGLYRHAVPGSYVLLPWVPTAGMIFRWFRDELGRGYSFEELEGEAADVAPGADDLILMPHFNGAGCPEMNASAKGVLYGLSLNHTRGHITRAIFESVACMLRENLDMLQELGVETGSICSLGGGAKNRLWLGIKADLLNRKVSTLDVLEATCLGAAMIAAVGAGACENLSVAAERMVRHKELIEPNPDRVPVYEEHYKKYLSVNKQLLPTFGGDK